jgi:2'-5' RNA ligase
MLKKLIILSCSFITASTFAMENNAARSYTVGIKIPNTTYAEKAVNPAHMTITYLGEADEKKLEDAKRMLAIINQSRPIRIKMGKPDVFGTQERPIPVMRLLIESPTIEELLIQMHRQLGVCEPSQTDKLEIPSWHVTVKDTQLQEEFLGRQDSTIIGGKLFIKALGNFDPVIELE